jgi:hypothetical protein
MNQNNSGGSLSPIVIIGAIIVIIASFIGSSGTTQRTTPAAPDRSSFEHRYATERFKLEGYSDSESKQAADAIIKFHNAQQARQR